jgi:hypothetical protein
MKAQQINILIRDSANARELATDDISDGYHTFGELYNHRIALYVLLAKHVASLVSEPERRPVWKSNLHSDGSSIDGWFVLGIYKSKGKQITYHLPMSEWDKCYFAEELEKAPEFDGHTSGDVLVRLNQLIYSVNS